MAGAWTDPDDPSILTIQAGYHPGPGDWLAASRCAPYTVAVVLRQDRRSVRVAVREYVREGPSAATVGPPECPAIGLPPQEHRLRLGAPLGNRVLVQDGRAVPVTDTGRLLSPTYLPDGFHKPGVLTPLGLPTSAVWQYPGPSYRVLWVYQVPPGVLPPDGYEPQDAGPANALVLTPDTRVLARPTIRGHEAIVFRRGENHLCARWLESDDLLVGVCNGGAPSAGQDELVKVAESLRPGRTR